MFIKLKPSVVCSSGLYTINHFKIRHFNFRINFIVGVVYQNGDKLDCHRFFYKCHRFIYECHRFFYKSHRYFYKCHRFFYKKKTKMGLSSITAFFVTKTVTIHFVNKTVTFFL